MSIDLFRLRRWGNDNISPAISFHPSAQMRELKTAIYTKTVNEAGLLALYYIDAKSTMPVIDFYDQSQNRSLGTFFPHQSRSTYWAVSHDGKFIATTGRGGPVRIWNVEESIRDLLPL
jgi:WD40 repeat protein